jgi:hypothetical protein
MGHGFNVGLLFLLGNLLRWRSARHLQHPPAA